MRNILMAAAAAALGLAPVIACAAGDPRQMSTGQASPREQVSPEVQAGPQTMPAPSGATQSSGTVAKAGAALRDLIGLDEKYQGQMANASPQQKQTLNAQANAEAVQAIQSHGLSVQEYTNVIRTARNNPQVKQQLLDAAKSGD
jgi:hypothetical protein